MVWDFWESNSTVLIGTLNSRSVTQRCLSVSETKNFVVQQSPRSDYGYRAYGELSPFVYCLLHNIKISKSLPLVERWDYIHSNHSSVASIQEENFLVGTRVHAALEKTTSYFLNDEFRSSARSFLEEFTSTVLSTIAARSKLGQGVSCFCFEKIIVGDDLSASFFHRTIPGRLDRLWVTERIES